MQHDVSTYKDGYQHIAFCKICSAEGEKLSLECVGMEERDILNDQIKNIWKDVDKIRLRS